MAGSGCNQGHWHVSRQAADLCDGKAIERAWEVRLLQPMKPHPLCPECGKRDFRTLRRCNGCGRRIRRGEGADLPPLLVCKQTRRVVDGQHRLQAAIQVFGDDAQVPCVLRVYANEEELFADAIRENAKHGLRFGPEDYEQCVKLAQRLKITAAKLAPLLQVSVKTLEWKRITNLTPAVRADASKPAPRSFNAARRGGSRHSDEDEDKNEFRGAKDGSKRPAALDPKDKLGRAQHFCQNLTLLLDNGLLDGHYEALVRDIASLKIAIKGFLERGQARKVG